MSFRSDSIWGCVGPISALCDRKRFEICGFVSWSGKLIPQSTSNVLYKLVGWVFRDDVIGSRWPNYSLLVAALCNTFCLTWYNLQLNITDGECFLGFNQTKHFNNYFDTWDYKCVGHEIGVFQPSSGKLITQLTPNLVYTLIEWFLKNDWWSLAVCAISLINVIHFPPSDFSPGFPWCLVHWVSLFSTSSSVSIPTIQFSWAEFLYPPHNEVVGGYIGFTPSVRPSLRPASRIRSV